MINNNECGVFNPKLLESFNRVADKIYDKYYGKLFDENRFTL